MTNLKSKLVLIIGLFTSAIFFAVAAPVLTDKWQINTSNGQKIPSGWEPFSIDSFDKQDPFLLRRSSSAKWDSQQKWEINTAGFKIPAGWEPYAYDGNDEFDPVLLRRSSSVNWDPKQKWEIKTAGLKIPIGWAPFAYDSKDQFDPFLLRQRVK